MGQDWNCLTTWLKKFPETITKDLLCSIIHKLSGKRWFEVLWLVCLRAMHFELNELQGCVTLPLGKERVGHYSHRKEAFHTAWSKNMAVLFQNDDHNINEDYFNVRIFFHTHLRKEFLCLPLLILCWPAADVVRSGLLQRNWLKWGMILNFKSNSSICSINTVGGLTICATHLSFIKLYSVLITKVKSFSTVCWS